MLQQFAEENNFSAAQFSAIGAFSSAELGWFDPQKRDYKRIPAIEQVEVLALSGVIALDGGRPKVHAHVVLGKCDGSAHGGHLIRGIVRPTLELILTESAQQLRRKYDPRTGLMLIDLGQDQGGAQDHTT
jgi:uncharacterized protein